MKTIRGASDRYLDVDLTSSSWTAFTPSEADLRAYIGGKGLGLKIFADRAGPGLAGMDPLGPDNMLLFMMGLFVGTGAPCSARFEAISKSPLTGIMATASCGGPFGMALKTAGWDGMLIRGAAAGPTVLRVDEDGVRFEAAGEAWGMRTKEAQEALCPSPRHAAAVIGPAGENLVAYANIASGHRFVGRGGMGAVMGSKNLKAVVARGRDYRIEPADPARFARIDARSKKRIARNSFTKAYADFGTNFNVNFGVDAGFAPVMNFRDRTDERCRDLSGQAMAERYKTEREACMPCTVLCGHRGTYPDGKVRPIPEYETIGLWGGNIGNFDPDLVGSWNEQMNGLGMDTISAGGTVAWAMEAAEKGLRPSGLAFGRVDNIASTIEDIAYRRGEGAELALGSRSLGEKYGGSEFAIHVKGLEMAAYDPRGAWGQGLGFAVTNRGGCHLGSYTVSLEALFGFLPPYTALSKPQWVDFFENLFSAVNSLHTCLFTVFGYLLEPPVAKYTPKPILKLAMLLTPRLAQALLDWSALSGYVESISGRKCSPGDFYASGRRTQLLERAMNVSCGIGATDDSLPPRFLAESRTKHARASVVPLEDMKKSYYRIKGYDADGVPTPRTLARAGVDYRIVRKAP
ncbi:MAG: aldehyde ferredoxin oxidoreductase family protein [Spirochaetes bacterium]|nr:aldehyde ferredoxin oxidoreductase family protein [Spirochaetota bacterium]